MIQRVGGGERGGAVLDDTEGGGERGEGRCWMIQRVGGERGEGRC